MKNPKLDGRFQGWVITAAVFLTLLLTVGIPFYGLPFFYDYFIREFGWSRAQVTSGIALATILIQPAAGLIAHRFSPRRLILAGCVLLFVALSLFGLGRGILLFYYAAWCVFMTGYVFAGPLPNQVILTNWFQKNRGLAMGIAYLGLGLGGAVSQKWVALPLIQHFGWRWALVLMGASTLLVIPVSIFVLKDRPRDGNLVDLQETARENAQPPLTFCGLLQRSGFWLLALGSSASIGAIGSINQHMKLLFQDAGLTDITVADTTFTILISSLFGRILMGWLADRYPKKAVMIAACFFVACSIPVLFWIDRAGASEVFAVIFGFGLGADYMLIPLLTAELFGKESLARVMGIILPVDSLAQTCFPFALGLLRDRLGAYQGGLMLVLALSLIGLFAIAALPSGRVRSVDLCEAGFV
jgi:MFS family permease